MGSGKQIPAGFTHREERIPISSIIVNTARRPANKAGVDQLVKSMRERGQLQAIGVRAVPGGRFRLVFGFHRVLAATRLGWKHIDAKVMDFVVAAAEMAEMAEIDENLCRVELDELQRAEAMARLQELYEAMNPGAKRGAKGGRKPAAGSELDRAARSNSGAKREQPAAQSFVAATAAKTGLHPGTISRAAKLGRDLPKEVKDVVRGTPLAKNAGELQQLAKIAKREDTQAAVTAAQCVLAGEAATVKEASTPPETLVEEASEVLRKLLANLKDTWRRKCGTRATGPLGAAVLESVALQWIRETWGT